MDAQSVAGFMADFLFVNLSCRISSVTRPYNTHTVDAGDIALRTLCDQWITMVGLPGSSRIKPLLAVTVRALKPGVHFNTGMPF